MFDSNSIFRNPAVDTDGVIRTVLAVFNARWKSFMCLSLIQAVCQALVVIFFALCLVASIDLNFVHAHSSINDCVDKDQIQKHAQTFYNYMTNDSATSATARFLADVYTNGNVPDDSLNDVTFHDCNSLWDKLAEIPFQLIFLGMAFIMSLLLVSNFMTGSIMHAVAEVHSGSDSLSISRSLNHGFKKMCNIFTFNALLMLVYSIGIILFVIVLAGIVVLFASLKLNVLGGIIYFLGIVFMVVVMFVVNAVMMGGAPSIIVEGVSALGAFGRSYDICKGSICFIFTTTFCFQVLAFIVGLIFNALQEASPNSVTLFLGLIRFVMNLAIQILGVALPIVLYISIRVRSEGLTQQQLAQELGQTIAYPVSLEGNYKDDVTEMTAADTKTLV